MKFLNSSIYPAIFNRKSTRSYSNDQIPEETLAELRKFLSEVIPLIPSEQVAFEIQEIGRAHV